MKNFFIKPSTWLGALYVLISFLHVSCEGCSHAQLDRDRDSEIAKLEIYTPEGIAYINGTLLVKVGGKITEKHIPETSKLCLLLLPKGRDVKKAIDIFQKCKGELGYGDKKVACILLSTTPKTSNEGAVYYMKEIQGADQGKVTGSALIDLPPGGYEAYLLLHSKGYGTVFSNVESLEILLPPDKSTAPSISMVDNAVAEISNTDQDTFLITTQVNTDNLSGKEIGWCLFVDNKDASMDARIAIIDFLQAGEDNMIPTDDAFTAVGKGKAFVHPFDLSKPNKQLEDKKARNIFQRGATYKVYGCLFYINKEGKQQYVVSGPVEMTIPKPFVELKIKAVKIEELIKYDPTTDGLIIEYAAEITKEENISPNPQIGLLFVKDAAVSNKAGIQKIQNLFTKPPTNNYYQDAGDVAYLIGGDKTKLKDKIDTPFIPLEPGVKYYVYFYFKDGGGEIFLSKNNVSLMVPMVKLGITQFYTNVNGIEFHVTEDLAIIDQLYFDGYHSIGYILVQENEQVTKDHLRAILQNTISHDYDKDKNGYSGHVKIISDTISRNFMDVGSIKQSGTHTSTYDKFDNGTLFDVYIVASCKDGRAIFCEKTPRKFVWEDPNKIEDSIVGIKGWENDSKYNGIKYGVNLKRQELYKDEPGKGFSIISLNNILGDPCNNEEFIRAMLQHVFKCDGINPDSKKIADNQIDKFMTAMTKIAPGSDSEEERKREREEREREEEEEDSEEEDSEEEDSEEEDSEEEECDIP